MSNTMSAVSVHKLTNRPPLQKLLFFSLLGAYIILLARTAWMCDDAFITLRTVDNFVQGYGLVWNVGERVQVYTHPLWMFLLSAFYAFTREPYFTTLIVSMALSLATVALLLWVSHRHLTSLLLVGILLIGSKAFADYSTSGLENPLAHLLLAVFFVLYLRQPLNLSYAPLLGILAGLVMLNRLDHGLLVVPALLAAAVQLPRRTAFTMLAAAGMPVAGWLLFSLVYYGFPFPNTFYAKQATGISRIEYLERGVGYLVDTAVVDGATLLGILLAIGLALWQRNRFMLPAAAAGIVLYVLYVIWIGGDFMGGRMFSAPMLVALTLLTSIKPPRHIAAPALLLTLVLVIMNRPYLTSTEPLRGVFTGSIRETLLGKPATFGMHANDERQFYAKLWLSSTIRGDGGPTKFQWARDGLLFRNHRGQFNVRGTIGMFGYYAGQQTYVLDVLALSDPFLARIKRRSAPTGWRIGHIARPLPEGYLLTKFTDKNKILDYKLSSFYDKIKSIMSDDIFYLRRLQNILDINLNNYYFYLENEKDIKNIEFNPVVVDYEGIEISDKELNIILGISASSNHYLFLRTRGSYKLELIGQRGSVVLAAHRIAGSEEETTRWLRLLDGTDSVRFTPLENNLSTPVIYFVLISPVFGLEPDYFTVESDTLAINLFSPVVALRNVSNSHNEPLWLATHKRDFFFLRAASQVSHILEVKATPLCPIGKTQTVRLWLNGQQLTKYTWMDCSQAWEEKILIPADRLLPGWNLLEAEAEHSVVPAEVFPGNNDRRTLSVAFWRLWARPAQ